MPQPPAFLFRILVFHPNSIVPAKQELIVFYSLRQHAPMGCLPSTDTEGWVGHVILEALPRNQLAHSLVDPKFEY